jgi:ABC-2 type transport system ATP-binding protein
MTQLLLLEAARIDVGGAPLCDGLSVVSEANRVGLAGDWSSLFALLAGRGRLVRGRAEIAGARADRAVREGRVGLAVSSVGLPGSMRVLDCLRASARLAGFSAGRAPELGRRALGEFGLEPLAGRRIREMSELERRGLGLAHAVLGGPTAIALEEPLGGLDDASAGVVARWIERAATGRRLLVSGQHAGSAGPERGLFGALDEVLVLGSGRLLAQGSAADALGMAHRYSVVVRSRWSELGAALGARGIPVTLVPLAGGSVRLVLELPRPEALDLVRDAVVELEAPLLELVPLASLPDRAL